MLLFLDFVGETRFLLLLEILETLDFLESNDYLLMVCLMQGILSKLFLAEFSGRFFAVDLPFYEDKPETDFWCEFLTRSFLDAPDL